MENNENEFVRPELHYAGPVEYDLAKLQRINIADMAQQYDVKPESLWVVTQSQGPIPDDFCPYKTFKFLLAHNLLKDCLDLNDAKAIEEMVDPVSFDKLFLDDKFMLWKSAHWFSVNGLRHLQIPYFYPNSFAGEWGKGNPSAYRGFGYDSGGNVMTPDILMYPL
ncbi:MAG: hypothetical protein WCW26_01930 [Candidatus Buchananbacteria bacterium]